MINNVSIVGRNSIRFKKSIKIVNSLKPSEIYDVGGGLTPIKPYLNCNTVVTLIDRLPNIRREEICKK